MAVESDLAQLQKAHETTRPVMAPAKTCASVAESASLDWFVEPYKSLDMPPPIPADWADNDPLHHSTHAVTTDVSSMANILPLSAVVPTRINEPQTPVVETTYSFEDAVRENEEMSRITPAQRVAAPAAASHRFWEDNTLYDTSVLSHAQNPAPTTFVASSNLMMSASANMPNVAMPLEAVASGDAGTRFASGDAVDAASLEDAVAMWSRSRDSMTHEVTAELEATSSASSAMAGVLPTVDETLAEINRQFGMPLPPDATAPTENVAALPLWWNADDATTAATFHDRRSTDDAFFGIAAHRTDSSVDGDDSQPVTSVGVPSVTTTESDDPLSSLRAQLATMFDLPARSSSETDLGETAEAAANGGASHDDSDCIELTLVPTAEDVSSLLPPEANSHIESESSSILPADKQVTANDVSGSLASDAGTPPPPEAAKEGEEDDSVAAFMARLLSRSRGGAEVSTVEATALTAAASETLRQRDASNGESPVRETTFDPADRSHLTAEPKHKQDRQAARQNLQSFRQVAHQSARSALARHTTKVLLSAVVAKSLLLGVSTLATAAFLGAPLVGMQNQLWKGLACSLATLLSATEIYRSWQQLQILKTSGEQYRSSTKKPAASSTNASATASSDEATSVTSAIADAQ